MVQLKSIKVKVNLSNLMKMVWANIKAKTAKNLSEALKMAWAAMKAKGLMMNHKVRIAYRKVDGTIREAVATLKFDTPYERKSTNEPNYKNVCYYDLEKMGFRSFCSSNFICVEAILD